MSTVCVGNLTVESFYSLKLLFLTVVESTYAKYLYSYAYHLLVSLRKWDV